MREHGNFFFVYFILMANALKLLTIHHNKYHFAL